MLDIGLIREQPEEVKNGMRKRGMNPSPVDSVLELDIHRRSIITEVETLKAERNKVSKEIGGMVDLESKNEKILAMRQVGEKIKTFDAELRNVEKELHDVIAIIPNIPDERVPLGDKEEDNVVIRSWGKIPEFKFEPRPHWELGPELGIINFNQGVKISGSRFYVLSGAGARLQRALISWMLDIHVRQGYTEKYTPFIVKQETVFGSGQLPKFGVNLYRDEEDDLYLIPTAEVPLTGLHMDEILEDGNLPILYTAYSPCFRREKMSAGRDVRGIKRGHQFDKVEMYKFVKEDRSDDELEKMVADVEQTCQELGLPYRVLLKCVGDTSEVAKISYDIEVWASGCGEWLEVSSISNAGDYQSRRSGIRYRPSEGGRPRYVHTINGSGLGLPRTLIAVIENNQCEDGSILIPEVLLPWMGGIDVIQAGG
jgi:seryl-tRNA synthetase